MTRGQAGRMLVGVDLKKDANVLHAAYNDAKGVTAGLQPETCSGASIASWAETSTRGFATNAFYNRAWPHRDALVSLARQTVDVGAHASPSTPAIDSTPRTRTNTDAEFQGLAAKAGFKGTKVWTAARAVFTSWMVAA